MARYDSGDDYAYSGNEGRSTAEFSGPTASGEGGGPYFTPSHAGRPGFDASTGKDWCARYGSCGYCRAFTYHGLWHAACGDCVWRWTEYPQTMPASLRRYRADMPEVAEPA